MYSLLQTRSGNSYLIREPIRLKMAMNQQKMDLADSRGRHTVNRKVSLGPYFWKILWVKELIVWRDN